MILQNTSQKNGLMIRHRFPKRHHGVHLSGSESGDVIMWYDVTMVSSSQVMFCAAQKLQKYNCPAITGWYWSLIRFSGAPAFQTSQTRHTSSRDEIDTAAPFANRSCFRFCLSIGFSSLQLPSTTFLSPFWQWYSPHIPTGESGSHAKWRGLAKSVAFLIKKRYWCILNPPMAKMNYA